MYTCIHLNIQNVVFTNPIGLPRVHYKMDHFEKVKEGMTEIVTMKRKFSVFCLKL